MQVHVFVAMPFGIKKDIKSEEDIDFNQIYQQLIKPALEQAEFEMDAGSGLEPIRFDVFRADEELRAGNIRTDMFQELLVADLVVADLSIDNPNVWYELGVRHALRSRGIIHIQCQRPYMPFDVYPDRALQYHIKDGVPDPSQLEQDKQAIATMAIETLRSWHGRKISPVYDLLEYLQEPDWKSLRVDQANEFWEQYDNWHQRLQVAQKRQRPGDVLVLANEIPTRILQLETHRTAGDELMQLHQFEYALDEYNQALKVDPDDLLSQQKKGLCLQRLNRPHEARAWAKSVIKDSPEDGETWALLGRLDKDIWMQRWKKEGLTPKEKQQEAAFEAASLREAIGQYQQGFHVEPGNFYAGLNAVTLDFLLESITKESVLGEIRPVLMGGVRWGAMSHLRQNSQDYWARVTLADLEILEGDLQQIQRAYGDAIAVVDQDWFALNSSRQQLLILQDLSFRPKVVQPILRLFDRALERLSRPEARWQPQQVLLFSGHMVDAEDRAVPRFPAGQVPAATAAIASKLDDLAVGEADLAICSGACGGDLLFAQAALERGMRLHFYLPWEEPMFLSHSVTFAGEKWRDLFYEVKNNSQTTTFIMPEELGPLPKQVNAYERANLWQLYTALCWGSERVRFVCLWDGAGGDGPGGTKHMHEVVQQHSGQVYVLDTKQLWSV